MKTDAEIADLEGQVRFWMKQKDEAVAAANKHGAIVDELEQKLEKSMAHLKAVNKFTHDNDLTAKIAALEQRNGELERENK